jgi:hypothetical protein
VGLDGPGEEPGYYLASTNGVNSGPAPTPRAYQRRNEAGRPLPIRRQGGSGSESYTYYAPASGPMPPAATAPGAAPNYYANPVFDQSPGAQAGRASRRPARPRPGPLVRPTTTSARRSGGSGAGLNRPDLTPNQATNARPVPAPLEYGAASVSSPPVPSRPDYLPTAQPPLNPVSTSSNGSGGGNSDDGNSGGLARRTSLRPRLSGADLYSRETGLAYGATPPVARAARSTASNRPSSRP